MKRNYILSLLAIAMLMPFTALKAQYDAGDSTVCYNIMTNNFAASNQLNWNDPDPANWLGVIWNNATPKRIVRLELNGSGNGNVGNIQGTSWPINMDTVSAKYEGFIGSGIDSELKGELDFSALTELKALDLRNNDSISGVNVSGLVNLNHFFISINDIIDSIDLSGLSNLITTHLQNLDSLLFLDLSNCPRLRRVKAQSWGNGSLNTVNLTGSDSLKHLNLGRGGSATLNIVDLTGKTELRKFKANRYPMLQNIVGLNTCNKLFALSIARNDLGGTFDLADFDVANMYKFNIRNRDGSTNPGSNHVDSVLNWSSLTGTIEVIGVSENSLTLSNATQIFNELTVTNNFYGTDQVRYGGDTIYVTGSTSYPGEALIDINGTNVASTFSLFDGTGTQVGASNATGVFTFPTANDTGAYYVEMTNPGAAPASNPVDLVTDTFWVSTCPQLDTAATVVLTTITVNQSGATYQWLDCDNGNAVIAGATGQSYTATANGNYAVEITLGGVCIDTSSCINIATVGLDELSSNTTVRAYPNPMNEQVTIELQKAVANTQVTIVNVEGKVVYSSFVNTNKLVVDGSDWNNGIYIVRITNDEYTKTLKLIK